MITDFIQSFGHLMQPSKVHLSEVQDYVRKMHDYWDLNMAELSGMFMVVSYVTHDIPYLITPSRQFYNQPVEAAKFLDEGNSFCNHFLNDELKMAVMKKINEMFPSHPNLCCIRIFNVTEHNATVPISMYSRTIPVLSKDNQVIACGIYVKNAYSREKEMFIIYDRDNFKGYVLQEDCSWSEENYNLLLKSDMEILRLLYYGYKDLAVADMLNISLETIKTRMKRLRRIYDASSTHTLFVKLKILGIL